MNSRPDPQKAIYLKPQQRTLERRRKRPSTKSQWQPHRGECAIDAWGTAIRTMREQGVAWEGGGEGVSG